MPVLFSSTGTATSGDIRSRIMDAGPPKRRLLPEVGRQSLALPASLTYVLRGTLGTRYTPKDRRVAINAGTMGVSVQLLGKDQFFGALGEAQARDFPNPRRRPYPVQRTTDASFALANTAPATVVPRDPLYTRIPRRPFPAFLRATDTAFALTNATAAVTVLRVALYTRIPRRPFPVFNLSITETTLAGKDVFYGGMGQVPTYHQPNPLRRRRLVPEAGQPAFRGLTFDHTGSLAATEGIDTAAITASATTPGTMAAFEAADTALIVGFGAITGTMTAQEGFDVPLISGDVASVGVVAATEGPDVVAILGGATPALSAIEAADAAAVTGDVASVGTADLSEASDAAAIIGLTDAGGVLAATEDADTALIVEAVAPWLTVTGPASEWTDSASPSGGWVKQNPDNGGWS